jgi:sugar phosphate permease
MNNPAPAADVVLTYESVDHAEAGRFKSRRAGVFALTWVAYATYYFGRQAFPVVKATLQKNLGLSVDMLGWIDTAYLAAYAVGQFASGQLGDRIGARRLIGLGMIGSAAACVIFGSTTLAGVMLIAFVFNGLFQSTGWPGTCKAMGAWITPQQRGVVMGFWSTCYQLGPFAATWTATYLFAHYGWRWAFFGPAMFIALIGVLIVLLLPDHRLMPAEKGTSGNSGERGIGSLESLSPEILDVPFSVLREPVLWSLGAAYFSLKLIRYSILFWLPYYLTKVLHYPEDVAGYRSVSFLVGGVLGSVVVGLISDRWFPGRRRLISSIMCAMLAGALLLYIRVAPISMSINFASMALIGFCLFGPDTVICGAAAQDIGGKHNVAKAAGFINGVGSVGAIFQGVVTSTLSKSRFGWNGVFYLFVVLSLLSSIALLIGKSARAVSSSDAHQV